MSIYDVINPSPVRELQFELVNDIVYVSPPEGFSLRDAPALFGPEAFDVEGPSLDGAGFDGLAVRGGGAGLREGGSLVRMELQSLGRTGKPVTEMVLGEYDPNEVEYGDLSIGKLFAAIMPAERGAPLQVLSAWTAGVLTDTKLLPDSDGDGVPNICDNCDEYNPDQADVDGDKIGDVCEINFQLGFTTSCGDPLLGPPGSVAQKVVDCTLTSNVPGTDGAQGWAISVLAQGVDVVDITVDDTVAAKITDSPPGLRDGGFEQTELAVGSNGAVSAVVLSLAKNVTLPPVGTAIIAKITVEQIVGRECTLAEIAYVDGLSGSGQPVENTATHLGDSWFPTLGSCAFKVCPGEPESSSWISFDCNSDGRVDISDAVCHFRFLFIGGDEPMCRAAMDFNADGRMDISDGVAQLSHSFRGGPEHSLGKGCQKYKECPQSAVCDL